MTNYELTDYFSVIDGSDLCKCDICDENLPSGDNEGLVNHLLNNHLSPIIHLYEITDKVRKNLTVKEFVDYVNDIDDDLAVTLDEKEIDNAIVGDEDDDLTEYEVVRQVSRNERAYVMAKDHEEAVEVFDKLKESELDIQDFDDEYKVDGDEL